MHHQVVDTLRLPPDLAGTSTPVARAVDAIRCAADSRDPVLIVAERGFDAEGIARAIHGADAGAHQPFVVVDCADDRELLRQQLFGTSAADADYEVLAPASLLAGTGTIYLAAVDECPAALQIRLARVLRDGEARVSGRVVPLRARIIAATERVLEADVEERRFRADLYRRLQRIRVDVPPLRARNGDLSAVITAVFEQVCAARRDCQIAPAALTALSALPWPGNVAELRAVLARLAERAQDDVIRQEDVLADLQPGAGGRMRPMARSSLRQARRSFERDYIASVLEEHQWRMSDAARVLGIQRANLYRKTRQLGITRVKPSR
jgi:DNA-binding NtrC family response regulator